MLIIIVIIDSIEITIIIIEYIERINNYQHNNPRRKDGPYSIKPFVPKPISALRPLMDLQSRADIIA